MLDNSLVSIDGTMCESYEKVDLLNMQFLCKNMNFEKLSNEETNYVLRYVNYSYNSLSNGPVNYKIWLTMYNYFLDLLSKNVCNEVLIEKLVDAFLSANVIYEGQELEEANIYRESLKALKSETVSPSSR